MEENRNFNEENSNEMKQVFLSSAISDISSYIQLSDTKVSIIMGSMIALLAGLLACYEPIFEAYSNISKCSWISVWIYIFSLIFLVSVIAQFIFGILTIRGHSSNIGYKSKWFLTQSIKEYSFDLYKQDLCNMTNVDIIVNMAAELYKLNDINRQKSRTMKWVMVSFAISLFSIIVVGLFFLLNIL